MTFVVHYTSLSYALYSYVLEFSLSIPVFDTRTGQYTGTFEGHDNPVTCLQFEESLHTVVSGSRDTTIKVWDLRTFRCLQEMTEHTDWIKTLRFDAHNIFSASYDCTLKQWDMKTFTCKRTFSGHKGCINAFQYNDTRVSR